MKTLADQIAYEAYSMQHYARISQASAVESSLQRALKSQLSATQGSGPVPLLRSRLAYVMLITLLAVLTISRVVIAMTSGGNGGGNGYLVR